jgi:hypothetical protein
MPKKTDTAADSDTATPPPNPTCPTVNPAPGLGHILITLGLTGVGILGIVMGVRTIRQSPPMPPPMI